MGQQIKKRIKIRQPRFVWHREEPVFFDLDFFDQVIVKKGLIHKPFEEVKDW
jgi:hypothetical protein